MQSNSGAGAGAPDDGAADRLAIDAAEVSPAAADPVVAAVTAALDLLCAHATDAGAGVTGAVRIDRIAALERLRATVAAAQNTETVAFAQDQVEEHITRGDIDPAKVGRGVADQIALACRISPSSGSRRLNTARILHSDLSGVHGLLAEGRISEDTAGRVVSETRHLTPELRRAVDAQVVAAGIDRLSPARAAATAKDLAYRADKAGYLARGRTARKDRRIGLRPAPDTMAVLTGYLPVEQGVACLAALRRHADTLVGAGGELRSRDQVMADTLVERVTGQVRATDVNVEVGIVLPVDALIDPDSTATAQIVGHGPVPAGIARDILAGTEGKRWWRRLFARPKNGPLIGCDPKRRLFSGVLDMLIRIRDGDRCRDPFCEAHARQIDHIDRARSSGPTSYVNGRAVCVRGNQTREIPGWRVELVHDGLGDEPHTVRTTTPTGHTYVSRAGPP
ncbi:DUF222 domain-containing protein [Pseudonocardia parietis]|uniref:DUF222 domain-containing protein n=1 Tax=Pseudonocardia parietis TaxID=570936 RepID=A0ABS4VPZ8_9PSEU|nr:DUF222 domain-containing protein [Pseudonocardia parietis]MBP2365995.1 hypothetical protein [Pseudonocardia parietis]